MRWLEPRELYKMQYFSVTKLKFLTFSVLFQTHDVIEMLPQVPSTEANVAKHNAK